MIKRLSLRSALITTFIVQIVGAVGLVGYLSLRNGQRATRDLAKQLMVGQSDRVMEYLRNYTAMPPLVTKLNEVSIQEGHLDLENLERWDKYLFKQNQQFEELGFIYFGNNKGEYIEARTAGKGSLSYGYIRAKTGQRLLRIYQVNRNGEHEKLLEEREYDPRQRPWYQSAAKRGKPGWTEIYRFLEPSGTLGITFVRPYYDANRQLVGVLGADFVLQEASDFLSKIRVGQSGKVFIIERDGNLVASASTQRPSTDDLQRIPATALTDPLMRSTAEILKQRFDGKINAQTDQYFEYKREGRTQLVQVTPFNDAYGLDWLIVMVVPQSDFTQQIDQSTQMTIWLCIGALGIAIASSIWIGQWLTLPIRKLSEASRAIADGNFGQPVQAKGSRELRLLATSFNHMSTEVRRAQIQLTEYARSLEEKVRDRTQALQQKNEALTETLAELQATQSMLIQSEKLAALGQLVAGVAHEMNTPLGAIRSSVENVIEFFEQDLELLPRFLQVISVERQQDFFRLLERSTESFAMLSRLSSREKRRLKRELSLQLEQQQISDADIVADTLLDIGVYEELTPFWDLLRDHDRNAILNLAYQVTSLQRSVQTITTATQQASKVVVALKTYSHPGTYEEPVEANVVDGIETALTLYQNQIKRGTEIIRQYDLVVPICCFPDELTQVWTNLIRNAVQSMNYQGKLTIAVCQKETQIEVRMTDTGTGIPPEIQKRLFEPFFTTKALGEGTGLGLSIVKKIVEKHQGAIGVSSVPGSTTFTVSLPIKLKL
jgi:signal transduction histidine kinase